MIAEVQRLQRDGDRVDAVAPRPCSEWMYVLNGALRLLLGGPGEVAEFDTHTPHWFGSAGPHPVELLILFAARASGCTCARPRTAVR